MLRVVVCWGESLVVERHYARRGAVMVGTDLHNQVVVPESAGTGPARLFLSGRGRRWRFHPLELPGTPNGRLHLGGREVPLLDVERPIDLSPGDRGVLEVGPVQIYFELAEARPWRRGFRLTEVESRVPGSLLGAAALHLALFIVAFLLWDGDPVAQALPIQGPRQIVDYFPVTPPTSPPGPRAGAPAAKGEEGQLGEPEAVKPTHLRRTEGAHDRKPSALEALSALDGRGPLQAATEDPKSFQQRISGAVAGLDDGTLELGRGAGGMGYRGLGPGGGGFKEGVFGGKRGLDLGPGVAAHGRLRDTGPRRVPPHVESRVPQVDAFCREADVRRVVEAHRTGVSYCYEKALARAPELEGKVTLVWRIGLDGKVVRAQVEGSTLHDPEVEACLARVVERWIFPAPEGGQCQIRYPFVFSPGA